MGITFKRSIDKVIFYIGFGLLLLNAIEEITKIQFNFPPWVGRVFGILIALAFLYIVLVDPVLSWFKKEIMKETLKDFDEYFKNRISQDELKEKADSIQSTLREDLDPEVKDLKLNPTFIGFPIKLSTFSILDDFDKEPNLKQKEVYLCSLVNKDSDEIIIAGVENLVYSTKKSNPCIESTEYLAWSFIFKDLIELGWKQLFIETTILKNKKNIIRSVLKKEHYLLIYHTEEYAVS